MKITIDLDPMAFVHVAALSGTGLYGSDPEETVQALAMEGLRAAFRAGFVPVAEACEALNERWDEIERAAGASA